MLIRLHLLEPTGSLVTAETYNRLFTAHGVVMVFFFLIPAIPAVLGNFLIPLMIGAKDLAFPRINLLSWYVYVIGLALHALRARHRAGLDTGLDVLHALLDVVYSNTAVVPAGLGVFVTGFSSILTGLNFIVTIHKMRAPGLTWFRLPLFVWAHYATSVIQILGTPVIAVTILLVALERVFHFGFFDPDRGGDPILFQHLFWFYSHPAVYIMILPAMGVISELVTCFSRKRVFGYALHRRCRAWPSRGSASSSGPTTCSCPGQSVYASMVFSALSFLGGHPLRDQGLQLDGHPLPGLDLLADADALRLRLHRPLHHRGAHRPLPRHAGRGRARHRHLLHRGPLPLHHGGRDDHGLPGRAALLVAEDHRAGSTRSGGRGSRR